LLADDDTTLATTVPALRVARLSDEGTDALAWLREQGADARPDNEVREALMRLLPEYRPGPSAA